MKDIMGAVLHDASPARYPQLIDDFILTSNHASCADLKANFQNRVIPKRALVISHKNNNPDHKNSFEKFMNLYDDHAKQDKIKQEIIKRIEGISKHNFNGKIWLDIPNTPKFKEAITTKITDTGAETITLKDLFPIDDWVNAYSQNKWKAYVFCQEEYIKEVEEASKFILKELYNLQFETVEPA